ncbi:hypothetical protein LCGC14_1111160 [marine sediment metagenome]|uniref:Uncharacterized protein n=1 Tax=marine sediment metagenome TaxID=412755 RepID=A0A0F9MBF8_9ZZZZ
MIFITIQETKYGLAFRVRTQHEQFNNTERVFLSLSNSNKEKLAQTLKSITKQAVDGI